MRRDWDGDAPHGMAQRGVTMRSASTSARTHTSLHVSGPVTARVPAPLSSALRPPPHPIRTYRLPGAPCRWRATDAVEIFD